jgi:hypothetical protein
MTGKWPKAQIDHRDQNKQNDRWNNLREATPSQNGTNYPSRNKYGHKGVGFAGGKWHARISVLGSRKYVGWFDTKEQASEAYANAARELHGEFA